MKSEITNIGLKESGMSLDADGKLWQDFDLIINITVIPDKTPEFVEIKILPDAEH